MNSTSQFNNSSSESCTNTTPITSNRQLKHDIVKKSIKRHSPHSSSKRQYLTSGIHQSNGIVSTAAHMSLQQYSNAHEQYKLLVNRIAVLKSPEKRVPPLVIDEHVYNTPNKNTSAKRYLFSDIESVHDQPINSHNCDDGCCSSDTELIIL